MQLGVCSSMVLLGWLQTQNRVKLHGAVWLSLQADSPRFLPKTVHGHLNLQSTYRRFAAKLLFSFKLIMFAFSSRIRYHFTWPLHWDYRSHFGCLNVKLVPLSPFGSFPTLMTKILDVHEQYVSVLIVWIKTNRNCGISDCLIPLFTRACEMFCRCLQL